MWCRSHADRRPSGEKVSGENSVRAVLRQGVAQIGFDRQRIL
jgi:hypothetical protein